ncbi:MAG: hypothetical protein GW772_04765 [Flavobacteriia bacterium]|nr:hypothetical protein [Flavobacteriia bacterium]OIP47223.1 MAG: hypothetical protein AUK46_05780 [Flavobacteriaceae bacterium CG2_30_31_66]PIV96013.1 MAG: hypothetical protein COW43_10195 [Flavobacteriaceae bacterium CG17_big_fil_post_rev_8_21_14_2_50_31_13]PIY13924.1 MAG: hypothetical protein COZ16_11475 [Flavobacteriaceae bacterium CG_4_10_14_3_um_filter_31_253]PIZ10966.1 MAG: hypothetical protein COY55_06155 [Flavobacteriaceae bacterium CG_4_10_14_0_8_um_filter_31_99]PJC10957.1 MAG: hypot
MKKFFKFSGIFIVLMINAIAIYYFVNNESLPEGKKGPEAEILANKMLEAINFEAYKNNEILAWTFSGNHHYIWKKQENTVEVSWDQNKVILDLKSPENSAVLEKNMLLENPKMIKKATDFFNNDSFWLIAPYKIFDPGTERSIVKQEGKDALMVTYNSGGTTPGDSYLWILDENYFPTAYKMWVKIIPIGGVYATWNDWKNTESGIKLPTNHKLSIFEMEISITNVKATNQKANELADKILKAIKHDAYKKTNFIEWSFREKRFFKWDKKNNIVDVSWDSIRVDLNLNATEKSTIFFNEKPQNFNENIIKNAVDIFNNDSFWLVAPHKLYDFGVIRTLKKIEGKDALHVKYTTGGSTPGDSYLWILDENFIPKSFKMTVPSMNMKDLEATWEDWIVTESSTLLPKNHKIAEKTVLSMGIVKGYNQ